MISHHRDDDGIGELEKRFVELARHREWLFDQRDAFVREKSVGFEDTAEGLRRSKQPFHHAILANLKVHDHMGTFERRFVAAGLVEVEAIGREEAMSACRAPSSDARELEVDHLASEQGDDPVNRPAECNFARTPAHGLWEADPLTEARQHLAEHLAGRLTGFVYPHADVVALVGGLLAQVFDADTVLFRKAGRGLLGRAIRFEGCAPRRPHDRLVAVGLALREPAQSKRQAPWRSQCVHPQRVSPEAGLAH